MFDKQDLQEIVLQHIDNKTIVALKDSSGAIQHIESRDSQNNVLNVLWSNIDNNLSDYRKLKIILYRYFQRGVIDPQDQDLINQHLQQIKPEHRAWRRWA